MRFYTIHHFISHGGEKGATSSSHLSLVCLQGCFRAAVEQWPEGGDKKRMYAKHFFFRAQRKEMTAAVLSQCAVQVSFCRS